MPTSTSRVPFTEAFERVQNEMVRDKATDAPTEYKYKGAINEVYGSDYILLLSEDLLRKEAYITTIADYDTGTITVAAAGSSITGASTAWTSANSNDGLLRADDEDGVYRVAYSSGTQLNLSSPTSWIDDAVSAGSYHLIFDRFALASDFSHMVQDDVEDPEAVYYRKSGAPAHLKPLDPGEYSKKFTFTYGTPGEYTTKWIDGSPYLYINPADTDSRAIFYTYIPMLTPMEEYTTGTVTMTADPTVEGAGGMVWNSTANIDLSSYTYFFRVDADGVGSASKWYQISSITDADTLELTASYAGTTGAGKAYTISRISQWPARFDTAMLYGAALKVDPNNTDATRWAGLFEAMVSGHKAVDGKRIHGQKGAFKRT